MPTSAPLQGGIYIALYAYGSTFERDRFDGTSIEQNFTIYQTAEVLSNDAVIYKSFCVATKTKPLCLSIQTTPSHLKHFNNVYSFCNL